MLQKQVESVQTQQKRKGFFSSKREKYVGFNSLNRYYLEKSDLQAMSKSTNK